MRLNYRRNPMRLRERIYSRDVGALISEKVFFLGLCCD